MFYVYLLEALGEKRRVDGGLQYMRRSDGAGSGRAAWQSVIGSNDSLATAWHTGSAWKMESLRLECS